MADSVAYSKGANRETQYGEIVPQIRALVKGEPDLTANLANIAAVLKEVFKFFWVGFYLEKDGELVLGPFQGPLACTRIEIGKGVCGMAFEKNETVIVPNVDEFPGHIACNSASKSEIVVPIPDGKGGVAGVLDVDSNLLDDFSGADRHGLENVVAVVSEVLTGINL